MSILKCSEIYTVEIDLLSLWGWRCGQVKQLGNLLQKSILMKTTCNELQKYHNYKKESNNSIYLHKKPQHKTVHTKNVLELYNKSGGLLPFGKNSIFGPGLPQLRYRGRLRLFMGDGYFSIGSLHAMTQQRW